MGDTKVLTLRQYVEVVADALGRKVFASSDVTASAGSCTGRRSRPLEIVSLPLALAIPARPLLRRAHSTHEVFDTFKIRHELGYRDVVDAVDAVRRTARYFAANPLPVDTVVRTCHDVFDYESEDRLVQLYRSGDWAAIKRIRWRPREPGFTAFGYGVERNPFDDLDQADRHRGEYDPRRGRRAAL